MRPKKSAVRNRDIGAKGGATTAARRSELARQDVPAAAAGPSTAVSSEHPNGEDVVGHSSPLTSPRESQDYASATTSDVEFVGCAILDDEDDEWLPNEEKPKSKWREGWYDRQPHPPPGPPAAAESSPPLSPEIESNPSLLIETPPIEEAPPRRSLRLEEARLATEEEAEDQRLKPIIDDWLDAEMAPRYQQREVGAYTRHAVKNCVPIAVVRGQVVACELEMDIGSGLDALPSDHQFLLDVSRFCKLFDLLPPHHWSQKAKEGLVMVTLQRPYGEGKELRYKQMLLIPPDEDCLRAFMKQISMADLLQCKDEEGDPIFGAGIKAQLQFDALLAITDWFHKKQGHEKSAKSMELRFLETRSVSMENIPATAPALEPVVFSEQAALLGLVQQRHIMQDLYKVVQSYCKDHDGSIEIEAFKEILKAPHNGHFRLLYTAMSSLMGLDSKTKESEYRNLRLFLNIVEMSGRAQSQKFTAQHHLRTAFLGFSGANKQCIELLHELLLGVSFDVFDKSRKKEAEAARNEALEVAANAPILGLHFDNATWTSPVRMMRVKQAYLYSPNTVVMIKTADKSRLAPDLRGDPLKMDLGGGRKQSNPTLFLEGYNLEVLESRGLLAVVGSASEGLKGDFVELRSQVAMNRMDLLATSDVGEASNPVSYDPETLRISGAPDGLNDYSYPLEFAAGHNPNGREGIGDMILHLDKALVENGRCIIHAGDQPISHYSRFYASLYGLVRFFIVMDIFHNCLIKPLEWVQDLGWLAFMQKFYKGLGMAKEGYRSSDIYNIYNLCNLLYKSYNSHGVKDLIAAAVAAIDESDPARQEKINQLGQLDDLLGYWVPLALWGVALYSNCIKAPTVEERRRWFGEYIEDFLPQLMVACIHLQKWTYAKDLLTEATVLRQLKNENHAVWQVLSACPELASQRYVELANKKIGEYCARNNVKMESETLMLALMTIRQNSVTKVGIQRAYDIRSNQSKTRTRPEMESELNQTVNILLDTVTGILDDSKPAAATRSAAKAAGGTSRVQQKVQGGASWVDTACMRPSQEHLKIENLNKKLIEPQRREIISGKEEEERKAKLFASKNAEGPDDESLLQIRTRMAEFNLQLSKAKNKLRRRSGGKREKRPFSIGLKRTRRRALAKNAINKYIIYPTIPIL